MIRRLRIQGYKSIKDAEITDLSRLVLLFGPNAAGKSNLLDALDLLAHLAEEDTVTRAFHRHRGNRLDRPLPVRWFFSDPGDDDEVLEMHFELDLELQPRIIEGLNSDLAEREEAAGLERAYTRVTRNRVRYELALEYQPAARSLNITHEALTPLLKDWTPNETIVPYIKKGKRKGTVSVKLERQSHPRVYDLPRQRSLLSEIRDAVNHPHIVATASELRSWRVYYVEPGAARTAVNDVEASDPGSNGGQLASFYHWLDRNHQPIFNNLLLNLKNIVGNIRKIHVEEGTEGFLELWMEEKGKEPFPAALISEGTLRLLCILGIAATPRPPAVVGYEEPENGVNPARLREMLQILETASERTSGSQFFITTHSAAVLDYFRNGRFIHCVQEDGESSYTPWEELPLFFQEEMEGRLDGADRSEPTAVGTRFSRGDLG